MHPMNETTLAALRRFPELLEAHYELFPPSHRNWAPASWDDVPSERLTAIEQICHVRDIEVDGYHRRFERALAEDNPQLPSIDTYGLAQERRYGSTDAAAALRAFRVARERTIALLAGLGPAQLSRPAMFEGYGPVTVQGLIHYLCSHDQQHLAGLQWLLGKIATGETGANP